VGFLNAALLFGLLGSLVPLIIHLLERRRLPTLQVPSLRFLRELNRRQMRRLELQRLLILIVRMLLVALIAFALARPTLTGPLAAIFPEDAPRALALLIDNSASMQLETETGSLALSARERARALLADLEPQDEVLVYALEAEPRDLGGGPLSPALAAALLDDWPQADGGADLRAGLARAIADLNARPQPQRELYLLSDFAAATLAADSAALPPAGDLRLFALPLSMNPPPNAGLVGLRLPVRPLLPGRPFELGVAARATGAQSAEAFPVELELDGVHRGGFSLEPAPGETEWRSLSVSLSAGSERAVAGLWRKQRDRFAPDDELAFTLQLASRLRVLLAASPSAMGGGKGARLSQADHVARALDPYRGQRPEALALDLEQRGIAALASELVAGRHLVVLCGGDGLDATRGQLLADFVAAGGGLVLAPSAEGAAELARHLLPRLEGPHELAPAEGGRETLAQLEPEHPLFADFSPEHRRVLAAQPLWRSFRTRPGEREILARFASGGPALLGWEHGRGRVRLLLFEVGPEGGELPYSSMFLPLLQELAQEAAGAGRPMLAEAGQSLSWPLDAAGAGAGQGAAGRSGANVAQGLEVLGPDGKPLPLQLDETSLPPRVRVTARRAGIYRLQARGAGGLSELGLAAVSVPPAEGLLAPLPADSIPLRLGLPGLQVIDPAQPLTAALHAGRYGKELARSILLLAALLMACELWLAQRAER
jgi:hypothetical protein